MKTKTTQKRRGAAGKRRKYIVGAATPAAFSPLVAQPKARTIAPKWRWHYQKLVTLRELLLRDRDEKLREAAEPIEPHSIHPADSATDEYEHDVALALLGREENAMSEVNDAITRILDGRYGICEASGVKIPAQRLRALPWCRYSLDAEQRVERGTKNVKCRIPNAVSLRGPTKNIPGTGTITREDSEGPAEEPGRGDEAKKIEDESSPIIREFEAPFDENRPEGAPER